MDTKVLAIASSVLFLMAACSASEPKPAAEPQPVSERNETLDKDVLEQKSPDRAQVQVSESILRACGLSASEAHFDYNSASLKSKDQPTLDKIAQCFISGPLAGRGIALIGHADSRGDDDYNMVLGEHRAQSVSKALAVRKVPAGQLSTTSRGEMDATGHDEQTWAQDRRVQLELVE